MKYNVTAYFCGHDHNAQHIRENDSSVEYFVTGAAHKTDPSEAHKVSRYSRGPQLAQIMLMTWLNFGIEIYLTFDIYFS